MHDLCDSECLEGPWFHEPAFRRHTPRPRPWWLVITHDPVRVRLETECEPFMLMLVETGRAGVVIENDPV